MNWAELNSIQNYLHIHPELSFQEFKTSQFIEQTLKRWDIVFHRLKNLSTGGWAEIGSGKKVYAFRADIDALPISESKEHSVVSAKDNIMHACGHDYHTTIGLGLLKYFSENPEMLKGKLRVIFQPGEEAAPGGAEKVVQENIWHNVKGILAVHVKPQTETGKFLLYHGPVQASSTSIQIKLSGPGGHTSKPSETVDLIQVAGQFIVQIQAYLNQRKDPRDSIAFAFGSIHGGSTHNIIPDQILLRGTLRTLDNQVLESCLKLIRDFSQTFARLYQIEAEVQFPTNCPATINNPDLSRKFEDFMLKSGRDKDLLKPAKPSMGADDFAFYLQKVPGLYLLVGGGGKGHLHSANLELDPGLIKPTVQTMAAFISSLLNTNV